MRPPELPRKITPGVFEEYPWNPMGEVAKQTPGNTGKGKYLHFQCQIRSKLFPDYPMASLEEAYCHLRTIVRKNMNEMTVDITYANCTNVRFYCGV